MIHTTGQTPTIRETLALAMLFSSFAVVSKVEEQTMDGSPQPTRQAVDLNPASTPETAVGSAPTRALQSIPVRPVSEREYRGLVNLMAEVDDFRGEDELDGAASAVAGRQLAEAGQIIGRYEAFLS